LPTEPADPVVPPEPQPTQEELDVAAPAPAQDLAASQTELFCPGGTHEGCHDYADMPTYLDHILALISPMFDELYGVEYRPAGLFYVAAGESGSTPCTNPDGSAGPYDSSSYLYCPANQAIYTGQDRLWHFYSDLGDAAPAVGYAHEWGHHIQTIMGVPASRTSQESVRAENQADCIAGAWVYYAEQNGYLEYPDDLGDLQALLQEIAATEGPARDHGDLEERTASVNYGYNYGLRGCNQYYPATPIYNG
jgi:hypothetical protein